MDTANYARVNPLPSPATSFSSSGELHLYIESDTSSSSVPVGPPSSSQELLLQGDQSVPQSLYLIQSTTKPPSSVPQPPTQTLRSFSWADEVGAAEHPAHSTPETIVPNWAYPAESVEHDQDPNRRYIYDQ